MVLDKFRAAKVLPSISWFTVFGLTNAFCYGLSHMMDEKDYKYYFAYEGNGRTSDLIRSNFGSNNMVNAAWTIPSLIFFGRYMHNKVGALTMLKFTPMAFFAICAFQAAFTPNKSAIFF